VTAVSTDAPVHRAKSASREPAQRAEFSEWSFVEIRQLSALAAVAEHRSFRLAAESLSYGQSAISDQIGRLEQLTAVRLVERSRGAEPASLTAAGRLLLDHAYAILTQLDEARADFGAPAVGPTRVTLGLAESEAPVLAPELWRAMAGRDSGVELTLHECFPDADLLGLVESGVVDAGLAELPLRSGPFTAEAVVFDRFVLVLPAKDAQTLSERGSSVAAVAGVPLASYMGDGGWPLIDNPLLVTKHAPGVRFRSQDPATLLALVTAGLGWAILPRLSVDRRAGRVAAIEISDDLPPRTLGLFWHREREPPALDAVRAAVRLVGGWVASNRLDDPLRPPAPNGS
jgi:DNA-binding transcriptional LysR family regulator